MTTPIRIHNSPFDRLPTETSCDGDCACWRDGFEAGMGYAHGYAAGADDGEGGCPADLPELPDEATSEYRAAYVFAYREGYGDGQELRRLTAERAEAVAGIARLDAEIAAAKKAAYDA